MLLLLGGVAQGEGWDCRAGTDGRSWDCSAGVATPPPQRPVVSEPEQPPESESVPASTDARPAAAAAASPAQNEPAPIPEPAPVDRNGSEPRARSHRAETLDQAATQSALDVPQTGADHGAVVVRNQPPPAPQAAVLAFAMSDAGGIPAAADERSRPALSTDIDDGIDWSLCSASQRAARGGFGYDEEAAAQAPVEVDADSVIADVAPERATFRGDVQLQQGPVRLRADELTIDRATGEVDADGNVVLVRPDVRVAGSSAHYDSNTRFGSIEQASYRLPEHGARGDAETAELTGKGLSEYRNISYTTCAPGNSEWLLNAEALELDRNEGVGTARDATLRFMGVPVMYAPVYTFPIDDRRKSGFLLPSLGNSSSSGFHVSVPYYFNLAPNYDLTVEPRLMSKRGLLIGSEFRFLTASTTGTLITELLPDDQVYEDGSTTRGGAIFRSTTRFDPRLTGDLRLGYVSDNQYLEDLGGGLEVTSTREIERAGELRYQGDIWTLLGRVQEYQTIDDSVALSNRPYSRLPQLLFNLRDRDGLAGTTYHLDAEYVNFERDDSVTGHRFDVSPAVSLPLRNIWGYVTPKLGARVTGYQLTDQTPGLDSSPSHATGLFSLDSGVFFERFSSYLDVPTTHTLEPRLYYLYVPAGDQDEQPVFDTTLFDLNFDNLFRENRFNGPDRVGDANQVTLALRSRMISDQSGQELLRASVGQIFYFQDREVILPGETTQKDNSSAVVGELRAELGAGWSARGDIEWNPHAGDNGNVDQALAEINYRGANNSLLRAGYRLRDGVVEQTDVAAVWPVTNNIYLIGRHSYSLLESRPLEVVAGIEYRRCCWRVRALFREYANSAGDDLETAFLLQLELNGLGQIGNDIDEILRRSLRYQNPAYD